MIVKRASQIRDEIAEEYRRNKEGWHMFIGLDKDSNPSFQIYNGDSLWQLKFVNPLVGFGLRVDGEKETQDYLERTTVSYGSRQLPDSLLERVVTDLIETGNLTEKTRQLVKTYSPLDEEEIAKEGLLLSGPVEKFRQAPSLTPEQKKTDDILRKEIAKYRTQYHAMYG